MKYEDEGNIRAFERGDVVWGVDPFKQDIALIGDESTDINEVIAPRPWLVIGNESVPFYPEQYLCVTLSTRTWHEDSVRIGDDDWDEGGAPEESSIIPWSVSAIQHDFLDTTGELADWLDDIPDEQLPETGYQGRLEQAIVDQVTNRLIEYLEKSLTS